MVNEIISLKSRHYFKVTAIKQKIALLFIHLHFFLLFVVCCMQQGSKTFKMTTLPRLAPTETCIKTIIHPGSSHREPQRKSFSSIGHRELSNSWGGSVTHHDEKPISHTAQGLGRSFPRLDPLHPPKYSRTVGLETTNPHFQNELRSLNMKREQYHKYHRSWMKPFYGSKLEQEDYR